MSEAITISIIAVIGSVLTAAISGYVVYRVALLEKKVDGRLTEILDLTRDESAAKANLAGRQELKQEQKERRQEDEDRETRKETKS